MRQDDEHMMRKKLWDTLDEFFNTLVRMQLISKGANERIEDKHLDSYVYDWMNR
jgi:hypothetical protein